MNRKDKIETKARPWLVKYAVRGGTSYHTFNTRDEALKDYSEVFKCMSSRSKGESSHGRCNVVGWPQMYQLSQPTVVEVCLSEL